MFDFSKIRANSTHSAPIEPLEIFRRLPKPSWINDLYTSQAEALKSWHERKNDKDIVLKLHTGGGKTLVGLLIAQSTMNEFSEPVLYLAPTTQLVNQTLEKAKELGIPAVPYVKKADLSSDFVNGNAIMVATYSALFHGFSRFGVQGNPSFQRVKSIIFDDAHTAFGIVRDQFTLTVDSSKDMQTYKELCGLFRQTFKDTNQQGVYDDVVDGKDQIVLEIPYWSWHDHIGTVMEILRDKQENYRLTWPLIRDRLYACHALVGKRTFTITPILPFVDLFPTFCEADRRVYMSATIADDSELIRTFDTGLDSTLNPITSRSLAGVSERLILIPEQMPFEFDNRSFARECLKRVASRQQGAVILVPSLRATEHWDSIADVAKSTEEVDVYVARLQERNYFGPVTFANRYDGIDLPGDSCRLLVMDGLPLGITSYETFRAIALGGGISITRMLAQRIEQGMGRGARGAGDHCVIILMGKGFSSWLGRKSNLFFLTSVTQTQLGMGFDVSKSVSSKEQYTDVIDACLNRDFGWQKFHAETLADNIDTAIVDNNSLAVASAERRALNKWLNLSHDKAIDILQKAFSAASSMDKQSLGWIQQFAGRIAHHWGVPDRFRELQREAVSNNRNLCRLDATPPYHPIIRFSPQAEAVVKTVTSFANKYALLSDFERAASLLNDSSSANQFEQAFTELMTYIGYISERRDVRGVGPDILVFLSNNSALVIEAKSRKDEKNPLSKREHAQLLVAEQWFKENYPTHNYVKVSIHKTSVAYKAASASLTYALTLEKVALLVDNTRSLLKSICDSNLPPETLVQDCTRLLKKYNLDLNSFTNTYLKLFDECD